MGLNDWKIYNPQAKKRVIVTKILPGEKWLQTLTAADCRVEVYQKDDILSTGEAKSAIGENCAAAIGQLTEKWGEELFSCLRAAGGTAYSNYAVGYDNVDLPSATRHQIPVGNTPGVLTETTAEMAVALIFAAARRVREADIFMRNGQYHGWLPSLFLGELLWRKTVGVIGAGRIGETFAKMMAEGHKTNIIYYDLRPNQRLEQYIASYGGFMQARGDDPILCRRADSLEDLLKNSDCVSIHTVLDQSTHHLLNAERLGLMKSNAILVNTSRGPIIDEQALVEHCRKNPEFKAALDVFEDEPHLKPGLAGLENVIVVPHIASATKWTREGMATLAAANVASILKGRPVWGRPDILPFLSDNPPQAAPSIVNAKELHLKYYEGNGSGAN